VRSPSRTGIRVDGTREIAIRGAALRGLGTPPFHLRIFLD
jgi:hypothetical protein